MFLFKCVTNDLVENLHFFFHFNNVVEFVLIHCLSESFFRGSTPVVRPKQLNNRPNIKTMSNMKLPSRHESFNLIEYYFFDNNRCG